MKIQTFDCFCFLCRFLKIEYRTARSLLDDTRTYTPDLFHDVLIWKSTDITWLNIHMMYFVTWGKHIQAPIGARTQDLSHAVRVLCQQSYRDIRSTSGNFLLLNSIRQRFCPKPEPTRQSVCCLQPKLRPILSHMAFSDISYHMHCCHRLYRQLWWNSCFALIT